MFRIVVVTSLNESTVAISVWLEIELAMYRDECRFDLDPDRPSFLASRPWWKAPRSEPICILRRIGEGGMGSVWLAEHAMLGRRAAIKVLHPELSSRAEIVTRFFNE